MKRPLAALLLLLVLGVLITTRSAAAAHIERSHDLASLAFLSDRIVLVNASGGGYVVEKVYAGAGAKVGERLEQPENGLDPAAPASERCVLFLAVRKATSGPGLELVRSGARFVVAGRMERDVQEMGRLNPVIRRRAVGHDPLDVRGLDTRADGAGLLFAEFEAELARAIERAARVKSQLSDVATHRAALLDAIGALDDDADPSFAIRHFDDRHDDAIATAILEALSRAGDDGAVLEGLARARGGVHRPELARSIPGALVAAANAAAPLRSRLSALRLLEESAPSWSKDAAARDALLALRSDAEGRVRAGAFAAQDPEPPSRKAAIAAVLERWPVETEPEVQLAMLHLMRSHGASDKLDAARAAEPLVGAERRGRRVQVAWDGWSKQPWALARLAIEVRRGAATVETIELPVDKLDCWGRDGTWKLCQVDVPLSGRLTPDSYALDVLLDLTADGDRKATRRVALAALSLARPIAAPAPSAPPEAPGAAPHTPDPGPGQDAGCSCRAGGREPRHPRLAALWLLGAALLRRQHGRPAQGRDRKGVDRPAGARQALPRAGE